MLSLVSLEIQNTFNVKEDAIGFLGSVYLFGCCTGALFFGYLASNFGRKKLFNITLLIYLVSVICISFVEDFRLFVLFRYITGYFFLF